MTDLGGTNTALEAARLRAEVAAIEASVAANEYRLVQLVDERERIERNIATAREQLAEKRELLTNGTKEPNDG